MTPLRDVSVGYDTQRDVNVTLPYASRDRGVAIIGKTGTGKSTLLERMILADVDHGTPAVVIDPHGPLAERVVDLAPASACDRLVLLEPGEWQFGINLLAGSPSVVVDSVISTVKKLFGDDVSYQPRLEKYLGRAIRTLLPGGYTLLEIPRLFEDKAFREACLAQVDDIKKQMALRRAWANYDALRAVDQLAQTEALVNRLERMFDSEIMEDTLGAITTTVPFDRVLAGNAIILLNLGSRELAGSRADFLGSLFLTVLADRLFARKLRIGNAEPERLHIYIDEYQRFASSVTSELLTQGRKFGSGLTIAHQSIYQIKDAEVRNASRQVGALVALPLTAPDADLLAPEFPIEPRPEWVEEIVEQEGWKAKEIPSPTPIADILESGHSDQQVALAVQELFPGWTRKATEYFNNRWLLSRGLPLRSFEEIFHHAITAKSWPATAWLEIFRDYRWFLFGRSALHVQNLLFNADGSLTSIANSVNATDGPAFYNRCPTRVPELPRVSWETQMRYRFANRRRDIPICGL